MSFLLLKAYFFYRINCIFRIPTSKSSSHKLSLINSPVKSAVKSALSTITEGRRPRTQVANSNWYLPTLGRPRLLHILKSTV